MTPFLKKALTALAIIIVGYGAYVVWRDGVPGGVIFAKSETSVELAAAQSFLRRLQALDTIELPRSIFSDARFQSLVDTDEVIPPIAPGRQNPFAPLAPLE